MPDGGVNSKEFVAKQGSNSISGAFTVARELNEANDGTVCLSTIVFILVRLRPIAQRDETVGGINTAKWDHININIFYFCRHCLAIRVYLCTTICG